MKSPFHRLKPKQFYYLIAAAVVIVTAVIYVEYRMGLRPVSDGGAAKQFVVQSGDNAPIVADRLVKEGLIRNRN